MTRGGDMDDVVVAEAEQAAAAQASSNNGAGLLASDAVLATAGYDHTIKVWNITTALCAKTFQHPDSQVNDLAISPDRKLVAAAGYQHARVYDVHSANQTPFLNFEGVTKNVTTLGFNRDGQWMFTGGEDYNARIWDLRTGAPACQKVYQTRNSPISGVVLHPSQTEIFVSDQSGSIHCWDLRSDVETEQLTPDEKTPPSPITHISIDPLGTMLAAVSSKGECYVWNLHSSGDAPIQMSGLHRDKVHKRYTLRCCFSPDSTLLATTSADTTAKVWKCGGGENLILQAELHCSSQRWVWDAAFTGDSQYLVTASSDNLARLWSIESGQSKREYNGHQKPLTCVAFRDPSMV